MFKLISRKKIKIDNSSAEERFNTMLELIKDLPKSDYNKLKSAMDYAYQAYDIVLRTQTRQDKENQDLKQAETALTYEETK